MAKRSKKAEKKSCWDIFLQSEPKGKKISILTQDDLGQSVLQRMIQVNHIHPASLSIIATALQDLDPDSHHILLNSTDDKNQTPLGTALLMGKTDLAYTLISWGANVSLALPKQQWLPVLLEERINTDKICSILTQCQEAIPQALTGLDPTHNNLFSQIIAQKNQKLLEHMVQVGIDPNRFCTPRENLLNSALTNHLDDFAMTLLNHLPLRAIEAIDHLNKSPLMLAAEQGKLDIVSTILTLHGDADTTNCYGQTALHHVCALSPDLITTEHKTIVVHLLNIMNDKDLPDHQGNTPAMVAALAGNDTLCNLCIENCDIFAHNHQNQNLLFLTTYTHCTESFLAILDKEKTYPEKPFNLLEQTCPPPKWLQEQATKALPTNRSTQTALQALSPLSLAIITNSLKINPLQKPLKNMINALINQSIYSYSYEDDPLFWTLITKQYHLTNLLIAYGTPIHTTTIQTSNLCEPTCSLLTTDSILCIRTNMVKTASVDRLFSQGKIEKAVTLAKEVHSNMFRLSWAQQYWDHLGDHFLLQQLEDPNYHIAIEKVFLTLQNSQISPYCLLDKHHCHPEQLQLKSCLQTLWAKMTVLKIQLRCTTKQKASLQKIGIHCTHLGSLLVVPLNQETDAVIRINIPSVLKGPPGSTSYQQTLNEWQGIFKTAQDIDYDKSDSLDLRELFLQDLHKYIEKEFTNNHYNPYFIGQQLLLLHLSPCCYTRGITIVNLNNLLTQTMKKGWIDTLRLKPILSILPENILRPLGFSDDSTQRRYFLDECEEGPLDSDQLSRLVNIIVRHFIQEKSTLFGREIYNTVLGGLLTTTTSFSDASQLPKWLQLGTFYTQKDWLTPHCIKAIMIHLHQSSNQLAHQGLVQETLSICAAHINIQALKEISKHHELVQFLTQPLSLQALEKANPSLHSLLCAFPLYTTSMKNKTVHRRQHATAQQQQRKEQTAQHTQRTLREQDLKIIDLIDKNKKLDQDMADIQQKHNHTKKAFDSLVVTHQKAEENLSKTKSAMEETAKKQQLTQEYVLRQQEENEFLQKELAACHTILCQKDEALTKLQHANQSLKQNIESVLKKLKIFQEHDEQQEKTRETEEQQLTNLQKQVAKLTKNLKITQEELTLAQQDLEKTTQALHTSEQVQATQKNALMHATTAQKQTEKRAQEHEKDNQELRKSLAHHQEKETQQLTQMSHLIHSQHPLVQQLPPPAYLYPRIQTITSHAYSTFLPLSETMPYLLRALQPHCIELYWRGSSARELLRYQHNHGNNLETFFSFFKEDIDWTLVSQTPIIHLQDVITQAGLACRVDEANQKLHIIAPQNKQQYDIKVFSSPDILSDTADNIQLHWDWTNQTWMFHAEQHSTTQHKFLHGEAPIDASDTFTLCSLFWAIHLTVKHIAFHSPLTTIESLIQKVILQRPKKSTHKNQAIIDILQKFSNTPYWDATITTLLEVPVYLPNNRKLPQEKPIASSLIRLLLPETAAIPDGVAWTQTEDFQGLESPIQFLHALKKTWQQYETNLELLDTKVGAINWQTIDLSLPEHKLRSD